MYSSIGGAAELLGVSISPLKFNLQQYVKVLVDLGNFKLLSIQGFIFMRTSTIKFGCKHRHDFYNITSQTLFKA